MDHVLYTLSARLRRLTYLAKARRWGHVAADTGIPDWARPSPHKWGDFGGPWIENSFFVHWASSPAFRAQIKATGFKYLPVFWTDLELKAPDGAAMKERVASLIEDVVEPDARYFTLVQHDLGPQMPLPENVLVFGAGGIGDVPIPLLKYPERRSEAEKRYYLSFMGASTGPSDKKSLRSRTLEAARKIDGFAHLPQTGYAQFRAAVSQSHFTLCPRGFGATSFRLYEAIALGSIPVYIWDDVLWLPYEDVLDWSEIALIVPVAELDQLQDRIAAVTADRRRQMADYTAHCFEDYFTYPGVCKQIACHLKGLASAELEPSGLQQTAMK